MENAKGEAIKKVKKYPSYGEKRDYRKIDVYHEGAYKHSTTWARNLKEAREKSGIKEGKIKAEYSK